MPSDLSPTETNAGVGDAALAQQARQPDIWLKAQREAQNRATRQVALDAALRLHPSAGNDKMVLETARRFYRFLTA